MVRLAGDTVQPLSDPWLSDYLGRHIRFTRREIPKGQYGLSCQPIHPFGSASS